MKAAYLIVMWSMLGTSIFGLGAQDQAEPTPEQAKGEEKTKEHVFRERLQTFLNSKNGEENLENQGELAKIGGFDQEERGLSSLNHYMAWRKDCLRKAIAVYLTKKDLPALTKAIENTELPAPVRIQAMFFCEWKGFKEVLPVLAKVLDDKNEYVMRNARSTAERLVGFDLYLTFDPKDFRKPIDRDAQLQRVKQKFIEWIEKQKDNPEPETKTIEK